MNRFRRLMGWHVHEWSCWFDLGSGDGSDWYWYARRRYCLRCPKEQTEYFPDGH